MVGICRGVYALGACGGRCEPCDARIHNPQPTPPHPPPPPPFLSKRARAHPCTMGGNPEERRWASEGAGGESFSCFPVRLTLAHTECTMRSAHQETSKPTPAQTEETTTAPAPETTTKAPEATETTPTEPTATEAAPTEGTKAEESAPPAAETTKEEPKPDTTSTAPPTETAAHRSRSRSRSRSRERGKKYGTWCGGAEVCSPLGWCVCLGNGTVTLFLCYHARFRWLLR